MERPTYPLYYVAEDEGDGDLTVTWSIYREDVSPNDDEPIHMATKVLTGLATEEQAHQISRHLQRLATENHALLAPAQAMAANNAARGATPTLNALLVKQAVHMGDHGQDITSAVAPDPGETVEDFAQRVLTETDWRGNRTLPNDEWYLVLRLVKPKPETKPSDGTDPWS